MEFSRWQDLILECVKDISDVEYQKKTWFAQIPDIDTSFVELICNLYDDFSFRAFLEELEAHGDSQDFHVLSDFNTHLRLFLDGHPDLENDEDVIVHPKWLEVCRHAQKVIRYFDGEH